MKKTGFALLVAFVASTLGGCVVRETRGRPCHSECYWRHGEKICERRCH